MFGIVINTDGHKVAFVVLKDGKPEGYKLKKGESIITKDWNKANAMGKPHWNGTEWEDLEPPKQIDICSEPTAEERITHLEADKEALAQNVYALAEVLEELLGGDENGQEEPITEAAED